MGDSSSLPRVATNKRRYRFGLRWLLLVVTLIGLACGWISWQHRRGREQVALVKELATVGFLVGLEEPTGVGLLVRKFAPERENWLREQIGAGWFGRPTVLVCSRLMDDQVPAAAGRLKRLGTVREIQLAGGQLSAHGAAELRRRLPEVAIVARDGSESTWYSYRRTAGPQFAYAAVGVAAVLALCLVGTIILFAWPLIGRQRAVKIE